MLRSYAGKRQALWKALLCSFFILAIPGCSGSNPDDDENPTTPPNTGTDTDKDGFSVDDGDCDDNNSAINPGAPEVCDGVDNNCNGELDGASSTDATTYYYDGDRDAYGDGDTTLVACTAPAGYVAVGGDCDDGDEDINPGQPEVCDGKDNNCNGELDGSNSDDAITWYYDGDKDGYGDSRERLEACTAPAGYVEASGDCDDDNAAINPNAAEICDSKDNDCDGEKDELGAQGGTIWYADTDNDGWGNANVLVAACNKPNGFVAQSGDCNDGNANVYPYANEVSNGIDDDCDGYIDEGTNNVDDDGDGFSEVEGDCNDTDKTISPVGKEALYGCDGKDQDCDGNPDDGLTCKDDDGDGYSDNNGDCNDANPSIHPGAADSSCDGIDQDCNGVDGSGSCSDVDHDGWSTLAGDCNDADPSIYPYAPESFNGIDDDCDGYMDEGGVASYNAIVFSEMLPDPSGDDTKGEWFELFNRSPYDLDLFGWKFIDNYTSSPQIYVTIDTHIYIQAGGYLVFGNCADTSQNGGIVQDYSYYQCLGGQLGLSNNPSITTPERLNLYDPELYQVTTVSWDVTVTSGYSWQLKTDKYLTYGASYCDYAPNCYCKGNVLTPGAAASCL